MAMPLSAAGDALRSRRRPFRISRRRCAKSEIRLLNAIPYRDIPQNPVTLKNFALPRPRRDAVSRRKKFFLALQFPPAVSVSIYRDNQIVIRMWIH